MKSQRYDGSDARRVLTGMITDDKVANVIASQWQPPGLFKERWQNQIGQWAVEHASAYGKAPGREIETIFAGWANNGANPKTVPVVERFLEGLSDDYDPDDTPTSDYVLDVAMRLFNRISLQNANDEMGAALGRGAVAEAEDVFNKWRRLELGSNGLIKLGDDYDLWANAFDNDASDSIISYGTSGLAKFIGPDFGRDCFVALMAPEKRGKSWWLLEFAVRAVRADRRRVAYFIVGDMSQNQVIRRVGQRVAGKPRRDRTVDYPLGLDKEGPPAFERRKFEGVTAAEAYKAFRRVSRKKDRLRIHCWPSGVARVADLRGTLRDWARDGWVADVVVIDYADVLALPHGLQHDRREGTNQIWSDLRGLSQEFHSLVLTATQADASSYTRETLGMGNFSEDKRKLAHVTGCIGLNRTDEEKAWGVYRLNWVVRREEESLVGRTCRVAGNLSLGRPVIKSHF